MFLSFVSCSKESISKCLRQPSPVETRSRDLFKISACPFNTVTVRSSAGRETSFSGEKQTIILRGIVRAADVAANNTVLSYNVANATVEIIGKGTVTDSQNKGWFNRIWDKLNPL